MRIKSMDFAIFTVLMAVWLGIASAQQSLTNNSIVEMVKAGLGESVVVDAIHTEPHQFSLSAPDLIALKQAGVSDAILAAMLTSAVPVPAPVPSQTSSPAPAIKSTADVRTIFIDGNNEAASNARNDMLKTASKYPDSACFKLVGVPKLADATLQIAESDTAGGSGGVFGGSNLESTVASGTLTNAEGDLLWSNSKQGIQGAFHTGAGDAARNLIVPLYLAAGCSSGGLRQIIEKSDVAPVRRVNPQNLTFIRKLYLTGTKEHAITSGARDLASHTCMEAVGSPAQADAIVVLEQSSDTIPRGVIKSMYSRANVESTTDKTSLWIYDEGDSFQPGHNGAYMWWAQLNEAVGCGKTRNRKAGDWPAPQPKI